jgi:hypothetical protein
MDQDKPTIEATQELVKSLTELKEKSAEVKARIDEERRRHDMPLNSNLGSPEWEESAADGSLDRPETDDEE